MIPVQNISGYWTGTITYGRGYKRLHGSVLYFEMNIIQDKETISGTATDTGTGCFTATGCGFLVQEAITPAARRVTTRMCVFMVRF